MLDLKAAELSEFLFLKYLEKRILFIRGEIGNLAESDYSALMVSQALGLLVAESVDKPIGVYLSSNGGYLHEGLELYDILKSVPNPKYIFGTGLVASAAVLVMCAGSPTHRYVSPNCRMLIHQPSGSLEGDSSDMKISSREYEELNGLACNILSESSGKSVKKINDDTIKDRWFSSEQAVEYGLADKVMGYYDFLKLFN